MLVDAASGRENCALTYIVVIDEDIFAGEVLLQPCRQLRNIFCLHVLVCPPGYPGRNLHELKACLVEAEETFLTADIMYFDWMIALDEIRPR